MTQPVIINRLNFKGNDVLVMKSAAPIAGASATLTRGLYSGWAFRNDAAAGLY